MRCRALPRARRLHSLSPPLRGEVSVGVVLVQLRLRCFLAARLAVADRAVVAKAAVRAVDADRKRLHLLRVAAIELDPARDRAVAVRAAEDQFGHGRPRRSHTNVATLTALPSPGRTVRP